LHPLAPNYIITDVPRSNQKPIHEAVSIANQISITLYFYDTTINNRNSLAK